MNARCSSASVFEFCQEVFSSEQWRMFEQLIQHIRDGSEANARLLQQVMNEDVKNHIIGLTCFAVRCFAAAFESHGSPPSLSAVVLFLHRGGVSGDGCDLPHPFCSLLDTFVRVSVSRSLGKGNCV